MTTLEPDRIVEGPAMLLGGPRRVHSFDDAARTIPGQWRELGEMGTLPGQRGATRYGVMCGAWPEARTFEYMCAVQVESLNALPPECGRMRVPAQRYAVFTHRGGPSTLRETWDAIWHRWLPRSDYALANTPEFEVYDARFDFRAGSGEIEVWASIRAK